MIDAPFTDRPGPTRAVPRLTISRPMYPEGIVTPLLLVAMLAVVGSCIERSDWSRLVIPTALVAAAATAFGSVAAKLRILDSLAHLLSMCSGILLVVGLVVYEAASLGAGYRQRLRELGRIGLDWYLGEPVPEEMITYLVSVLMGLIVWLVGYLAAWSLFRRGWLLVSLVLPGFLLLVNLGYAEQPETSYLAAYSFLALVLMGRYTLYARQREWSRLHLGGPAGLGHRFLAIGVVVAMIATMIGWRSPASLSQRAFQPLLEDFGTRIESAQDTTGEWMDSLAGADEGEIPTGGSYTAFDEAFSIGGPLTLTNEPQVVVFADQAPYLTAQHYDTYSGRGWYSSTEQTFDAEGLDGRQYAPEMTFGPNQAVPLSKAVTESRSTSAVEITPLQPSLDRMLTVDTHVSADVPSSVRMSWIQLDNVRFDLAEYALDALPRDIQRIAWLLETADLTGEPTNAGPAASDPALQAEIDTEHDQLLGRFLDVRWEADTSGRLETLIVTGQVPVYDDVEAVFRREDDDATGTYRVLAATSQASEDALRAAGTGYPAWVTERYLSLPNSITPRTVTLTESIVATADTPYEQARAIERYLRTMIVYDESVEAPPDDADIVDYLLFERQRGYCEYSASAMTVMLRAIGVPARVAVGFYPGEFDQGRGGYLYVQRNAHAWTEVFFPGYGWIPFEPTSSQPLIEAGVDNSEESETAEPTAIAVEETNTIATPTVESTPEAEPEFGGPQAPQPAVDDDDGGRPWLLGLALGAAALGAVVGTLWLLWTIPLRGLSPAGALFTRMRRVGGWIGVRPATTATPSEYGRSFVDRVPQARPHVRRIVSSYELEAYGPHRDDAGWLASAEAAWASLWRHLPAWLVKRRARRSS